MKGLQWETRFVPLAAGRGGSADPRALEPPLLSRAVDVEFDDDGGVQTRHPYTNLSTTGLGATTRRVYENGDELVAFGQTALLDYAPNAGGWLSKGTHLAIDVDELSVFGTTDDQADVDRAELGNVIVYAWTSTTANIVYVAAIDKATRAIVLAPTQSFNGASRPRLVALSTKILLLAKTTVGDLGVWAIDPASPGTAIGGAATQVIAAANYNDYFDAVKIPTLDSAAFAARRNPTTSYQVGTITAGLSINQATKARTCDGPIAVSSTPDAASLQIVRGNGTNVQGDLLVRSSLADTFTAQAVGTAAGTPINQIAAAHRSVTNGGQFRCYAFWSSQESTLGTTGWECKTNFVDTGNTLGTQSVLRLRLGVASRAFDYNGEIYVWLAFAGDSYTTGVGVPLGFRAQLQNTYFLYRDDGHLASKAVWQTAGGFSFSTGRLPGVALVSGTTGYAWCGTRRRIIQLGDSAVPGQKRSSYDARTPHDVTFTFDSNLARRTVRLGKTLYVSGGLICQYDGAGLWEVGTQIYPWNWSSVPGAAGAIPAGDYAYRGSMRWDNAVGERERSTTATGEKITNAGAKKIDFQIVPLHVTRKATAPAIEMWRTKVNPNDGDDFFLGTSIDPAVSSGDNRYLANLPTSAFTATWTDNMLDAALGDKQGNPENGAVIESLAPPGAKIVIASDQRLFLGAVAGDPDRVWYSKQRNDGEIAAFNDALVVAVPPGGGAMTGLALHDETLVAFRETAVYALPGDGFDNLGGGQNYGPVRAVSTDVGAVSQESIGSTPLGTVFKSRKGWYLLDGAFGLKYIGAAVADFDGEDPLAVHVVETQHQVRILTANRMLVWDYRANQWAEWSVSGKVHATMWAGAHVVASASAVSQQVANFAGTAHGQDVETAWIPTTDKLGNGVARAFEILGELRSGCFVRVRCAKDYREGNPESGAYDYFHDKVIDPNTGLLGSNAGDPLGLKVTPRRQPPLSAIKIRLTVMGDSSTLATLATNVGGNWISGGTIATSGTAWAATLRARDPGADGNALTVQIYTTDGPGDVEVRDGEIFDGTSWVAADRRVTGIRVGVGATVGALELAINDGSRWLQISAGDATPTKVVTDTNTLHVSTGFAGGTDVPCDGEGVRLTGIDLELGFKAGLNKRVPARQQS